MAAEQVLSFLSGSAPITALILFLHVLEFTLVYSSLYSEIDRCNIIHDRTIKAHHRYNNFHEISHSKETLLSVAIYFILAKSLLYTYGGYLQAAFLPGLLLFPPYFTFPLNKLYSFFEVDSKDNLINV